MRKLVEPSGLTVVDRAADADALVWLDPHDVDGLRAALDEGERIRWVQLPSAGVDKLVDAGMIEPGDTRVWTSAKGVYAEPVAEHALALLLAGLRNVGEWAAAHTWGPRGGRPLFGAKVTILGAGGIAQALLRLLEPFRVEATIVRRQAQPGASGAGPAGESTGPGQTGSTAQSTGPGQTGSTAERTSPGQTGSTAQSTGPGGSPDFRHTAGPGDTSGASPGPGVVRVLGVADLHEALSGADAVVVALALTPQTTGIIAAPELRAMADNAWLVNVGRGAHVVTDDLVQALTEHWIAGAALDVTDPEPLPDGHPLWGLPNCIITPHSACTEAMATPRLAARIVENAKRFAAGQQLLGPVDAQHGY
jgi:phosphoglycerate dehydrogenase-like enzyme